MRTLLLAVLLATACAPRAMPLATDNPANPDAETGRLAGPPSALRAGVTQLDDPARRPSASAHDHSTHEHGAAPATETGTDAQPSTTVPAPKAGAHQHGAEPTAPTDENPALAPKKTTPKKPAPKKAAPRVPAPAKPDPAKPAPHPPGHEGHH